MSKLEYYAGSWRCGNLLPCGHKCEGEINDVQPPRTGNIDSSTRIYGGADGEGNSSQALPPTKLCAKCQLIEFHVEHFGRFVPKPVGDSVSRCQRSCFRLLTCGHRCTQHCKGERVCVAPFCAKCFFGFTPVEHCK